MACCFVGLTKKLYFVFIYYLFNSLSSSS